MLRNRALTSGSMERIHAGAVKPCSSYFMMDKHKRKVFPKACQRRPDV